MTDWTPEKLDALPEGTVIEFTTWISHDIPEMALAIDEDIRYWECVSRGAETSEWLSEPANVSSIRIVSIPIDALLACTLPQPKPVMTIDGIEHDASVVAQAIVHAAIAHVTGGAA